MASLMLAACSGGGAGGDGAIAVGSPDGLSELQVKRLARPASQPVPTTRRAVDGRPRSQANPTTVVSTAPPTTLANPISYPTLAPPPPPGLGIGDRGVDVLQLEERLQRLGYHLGGSDGAIDNLFDGDTAQAVMAFQKVTGLERTGRATDDVVALLNATTLPPAPLVPGGGFNRVEVDRDRQVLFLYEGNVLTRILNVSTGSGQRFCSQGWCRLALTPTGAFAIVDQRQGWETGPLGSLYNSQYFNGAIAIHGSRSVPAYPASHGCVRISISAADWLPDHVGVGTPVYVVAAGEPAPAPVGSGPPASSASPVTTTVPTTTTTLGLLDSLLPPRR